MQIKSSTRQHLKCDHFVESPGFGRLEHIFKITLVSTADRDVGHFVYAHPALCLVFI
jgi:hypothetical protein